MCAVDREGDQRGPVQRVCGAVECVPRRLVGVEDAIRGSARNEETATRASALAAAGAEPLHYNHLKITLMENLVRRDIRDA